MNRRPSCGNPLIGSLISLGQLPVYMPDIYHFGFEEIQNEQIKGHTYSLKIAQRVWFWDVFKVNKDFEGKAGKALLADYYSNQKNTPQ